jgi:hypothetical protein
MPGSFSGPSTSNATVPSTRNSVNETPNTAGS